MLNRRFSALGVGAVSVLMLLPFTGWAANIEVALQGLPDALAANARAHLSIVSFADVPGLSETNIRTMHRRAEDEIRNALRPFGYYAPTVSGELTRSDGTWRATYAVDPGEPVIVGEVDVRVTGPGSKDSEMAAIAADPEVAAGDRLDHEAYERIKSRLRLAAYERGYLRAEFAESRLEVDTAGRTARVLIHYETGIRFRFGEVEYQQDVIDAGLMARYQRFQPGEPFEARKLLDLQYAMFDSGYFSNVEVTAGDPDGDSVPVFVRAEPGQRIRYSVGVGFATDTRFRFGGGWRNRRVNRRGHKANVDLTLSAPKQELEGRYVIPLEDPVRERLTIGVATTFEELGDIESRNFELSGAVTQQLPVWQLNSYVRFLREETEEAETDTQSLLIPGVTFTRTYSNDPVFPTRGSLLEVDVHGASQNLLSDATYLQVRADGRLVRPLWGRHRLLLRASLGASILGNLDDLPASERFFAGGDQSVRGFALNSLGTRDEDGRVIGGRFLAVASAEYEHRLNDRWALAVFSDAGNAIDEASDPIEYSAGVGVRYLTQIGMVRLDLAKPLSEGGDSIRVHFSFGPEL